MNLDGNKWSHLLRSPLSFTEFDHVRNQVHISVNFLVFCLFLEKNTVITSFLRVWYLVYRNVQKIKESAQTPPLFHTHTHTHTHESQIKWFNIHLYFAYSDLISQWQGFFFYTRNSVIPDWIQVMNFLKKKHS